MTATTYHLSPNEPPKPGTFVSDDIDLSKLELIVRGLAPKDVRPWISAGSLSRTILGASSVEITVEDPHYALLQSDYLLTGVDIKIDGVWLRFVALKKDDGAKLTLTFEDRAVALLRTYPKPPGDGHMVVEVTKIDRPRFAQRLVREVKETTIGFVCPMLNPPKVPASKKDIPARGERDKTHSPGFSDAHGVKVKGQLATGEQLSNIDAILHTGLAKKCRRKLLVVAIMVATQESDMRASVHSPGHFGVFNQDPRFWPATGDAAKDSAAFFDAAIQIDLSSPSETYEGLAERVQNPGDSSPSNAYSQWRNEAEQTVTAYNVLGGDNSTGRDIADANGQNPLTYTIKGDSAGAFTRGSYRAGEGWKRETSWDCLTRLANEVNWRCYADTGDIHFASDEALFRARPLMVITEAAALDARGLPAEKGVTVVDSISGDYDIGKKAAQLNVKCSISRWGAPPGSIINVVQMGAVFGGLWLVQTIERDLFSPAATITLVKAQPVLPSPEHHGAGAAELKKATGQTGSSRATWQPPGSKTPASTTDGGMRDAIVSAAKDALAQKQNYKYREVRPIPPSLFLGRPASPEEIDCSAFFTLCYKTAAAPDPNGLDYNGQGYTGTLAGHGTYTSTPQPGDACMYGTSQKIPGHVTVYIGDGKCISMGGQGDPVELDVKYRSDFLGYVTFGLGAGG